MEGEAAQDRSRHLPLVPARSRCRPAQTDGQLDERRFELADYVRVEDARLTDGLLHIDLVREVPESMKPKKIAVHGAKTLEVVKSGDAQADAA